MSHLQIDRIIDERNALRIRVAELEDALREIAELDGRTVFSQSRIDMDGNEAFMEGANTAFGKAAAIARRLLPDTPTGDDRDE